MGELVFLHGLVEVEVGVGVGAQLHSDQGVAGQGVEGAQRGQ